MATDLMPFRAHCDMPDENGNANCKRPAVRVLMIHGKHWSYQIMACAECADYAEKEARAYAAKDR
jgi:hypothetical protein